VGDHPVADFVRAAGLPVEPLPVDWKQLLASPTADRGWLTTGDSAPLLAELRNALILSGCPSASIGRDLLDPPLSSQQFPSGSSVS